MSGGGHFSSITPKNGRYLYLPVLKRANRDSIVSFFGHSAQSNTKHSNNPCLLVKPIDSKKEGIAHETDNIIKSSILQSGKGASDSQETEKLEPQNLDSTELSDSTSDSDNETEDIFTSISKVKTFDSSRKHKSQNQPLSPPPEKKFKPYKFNIIEDGRGTSGGN